MTRIHEQMYLEFNQKNKNSTQTYNIMWQLLWLNMTLRQHGLSDLHLDYDWNMIEPKINTKTWFKSRSIKFEP